jgi:hypothetical protein
MPLDSGEQELLALTKLFHQFPLQIVNGNMKVVSLEKLDNFYIERF